MVSCFCMKARLKLSYCLLSSIPINIVELASNPTVKWDYTQKHQRNILLSCPLKLNKTSSNLPISKIRVFFSPMMEIQEAFLLWHTMLFFLQYVACKSSEAYCVLQCISIIKGSNNHNILLAIKRTPSVHVYYSCNSGRSNWETVLRRSCFRKRNEYSGFFCTTDECLHCLIYNRNWMQWAALET